MDADALKAMQAPLKARYREAPDAALITLKAEGELGGPLYATLPVHTEGREVFLESTGDPLGGATSFVTALSLPFLLDGLVPQLAAAIDGDPATVPGPVASPAASPAG